MSDNKPRILFVDDELRAIRPYVEELIFSGFDVATAGSADKAIELLNSQSFDLFILDIMMPPGEHFPTENTDFGLRTGISLALLIRQKLPEAPIVAFTNISNQEIEDFFTRKERVWFLRKTECFPFEFGEIIKEIIQFGKTALRIFIVHGRDHKTLSELKDFLENRLGMKKLTVLAEQPSQGMTLIEKFEHYATEADIAFVLFTPDDLGGLAGVFEPPQARPRMNVIFELGYFLGALRRRSGRVFLLTKGDIEIPSDISGIVYIDITNGVHSAETAIRTELRNWL